MQSTLTNFIGSIIIMVDRAFKVGDWVKIGDAEGDVLSSIETVVGSSLADTLTGSGLADPASLLAAVRSARSLLP
jgi:MscS family membrane protein